MDTFTEISIILALVVAVSIVMKSIRQPLVVGYIIAGILAGPYAFDVIHSTESLDFFAKVGITVLLFIVGLQLSPKIVKEIGATSLITGIGQVVFTATIGYIIITLLGYEHISALYLAVALTFSSTIIILKLLTDYGGISKLYGKISIGFLLVQDVIAAIILIVVGTLALLPGAQIGSVVLLLFGKFLIVGGVLFAIHSLLLPRVSRFFASSQELLFLFSVAWGLGLSALFHAIGLSVEIGALIAGVVLSTSPFALEIGSRMKPLRDFFLVLFFILLGSRMVIAEVSTILTPALVLSLFILFGNPLIVYALMKLRGYTSKTALLSGFTVAQISEFSLILIALGVDVGHLSDDILSLTTLVGLITIAGSSYLIIYSEHIYSFLSKIFKWKGEKKELLQEGTVKSAGANVIIFGCGRMGSRFVDALQQLNARILVVDYNPEVLRELEQKDVETLFGDADDIEFLDDLALGKASMVISTIPDISTNLLLIGKVRKKNRHTMTIVVSHHDHEAEILYKSGATYVIAPHLLGAHYASEVIVRHGFDHDAFAKERGRHLEVISKP